MGRRKRDFFDFSDRPPEPPEHLCDKEGCDKAGEFRAPKDRSLKEYYWFCLKHVQEYNAAWDYYAGMSIEEIEQSVQADVIGNRPTWNLGERRTNFSLFDDPLNVIREATGRQNGEKKKSFEPEEEKHSAALLQAAQILEVGFPLRYKEVRANYKRLAKDCHPDTNGGDVEAEEKFKELSEAYRLLMTVLKAIK